MSLRRNQFLIRQVLSPDELQECVTEERRTVALVEPKGHPVQLSEPARPYGSSSTPTARAVSTGAAASR